MIIYTSIEGLELDNHEVRSYRDLDDDFREWIEETTIELLTKRRKSELKASDSLKSIYEEVDEQPFFMISNRSYFLDFYIPSRKVAVEIDGGYHRGMRKADRQRDIDFFNIGIRTVRISADKVIKKGIRREDLNNFSVSKKKRKNKHKKKPNNGGLLNKTHRKSCNTFKMTFDANWMV